MITNQISIAVKSLLLFLLLPVSMLAQEVKPVTSKDYLDLINKDPQFKQFLIVTSNNSNDPYLKLKDLYTGNSIKKIKIRNGYLKIKSGSHKLLSITGNFNSTIEIKKINQLPALQTQYVQGRAENGNLTWRGPETNELFSYGP